MLRIDTRRVVTAMTDIETWRNGAIMQLKRKAVGVDPNGRGIATYARDKQGSIAPLPVQLPGPYPTRLLTERGHVFPKSLLNGGTVSGDNRTGDRAVTHGFRQFVLRHFGCAAKDLQAACSTREFNRWGSCNIAVEFTSVAAKHGDLPIEESLFCLEGYAARLASIGERHSEDINMNWAESSTLA